METFASVLLSDDPSPIPILGGARSPQWDRVRDNLVKLHPYCLCCDLRRNLEVHHIIPFHIAPERELDPSNLIVLCTVCHFLFGHFRNWSLYNPDVVADCERFRQKLRAARAA